MGHEASGLASIQVNREGTKRTEYGIKHQKVKLGLALELNLIAGGRENKADL